MSGCRNLWFAPEDWLSLSIDRKRRVELKLPMQRIIEKTLGRQRRWLIETTSYTFLKRSHRPQSKCFHSNRYLKVLQWNGGRLSDCSLKIAYLMRKFLQFDYWKQNTNRGWGSHFTKQTTNKRKIYINLLSLKRIRCVSLHHQKPLIWLCVCAYKIRRSVK